METVFLKIVNMGIAGGWVILAVMLLRILLVKAPKAFRCVLWALAGIRLICPVSFESVLSLIPSAETVPPEILLSKSPAIESGINSMDSLINPVIASSLTPRPGDSANPMQIVVFLVSILWAAGAAVMLSYALISCLVLRRKVAVSVRMRDNLWLCDNVQSPFIFGLLFPRIYLPSGLGEPQLSLVIAHEEAHLKRHDHLWKPLGFLLLSVYWFQPLCWAAYILLCRDIELACDECVVRKMGKEEKKNYANALLAYSVSRNRISACPLAFGETGIKARVKGVLYYKKPAFSLLLAAVLVCIGAAVCFLTNPVSAAGGNEIYSARYSVEEVLYDAPWYNAAYTPQTAPEYVFTDQAMLMQRSQGGVMGYNTVWNTVGVFREISYTRDTLSKLFMSDDTALSGQSRDSTWQENQESGFGALEERVQKRLEQVERCWQVETAEESGLFYLVMQTAKGEVLMAACYGEGGSEHIRWLWKMEKHAVQGDTAYFEALISSMVSDSKIQIFALYESDRMPDTLIAGYLNDSQQKCCAVFKRNAPGSGWRITGFSEVTKEALGSTTLGEGWGFGHSVTIAFSSYLNLAYITAQADGEVQRAEAGRNTPAMFVFEWQGLSGEADAVEIHYFDDKDRELFSR